MYDNITHHQFDAKTSVVIFSCGGKRNLQDCSSSVLLNVFSEQSESRKLRVQRVVSRDIGLYCDISEVNG